MQLLALIWHPQKEKRILYPEVLKLFMLNSNEHEIYHAHICFVGILTFISMINTTSESLKARKVYIFQHFSFYEHEKKFMLGNAVLPQYHVPPCKRWQCGLIEPRESTEHHSLEPRTY